MRKAAVYFAVTILFSTVCILLCGCKGKDSQSDTVENDAATDSLEQFEETEEIVESVPMPSAADMLFEDFIFNFASNRKLQTERIKFPLPVKEGETKTYINRKQWQTEHFFADKDFYTLIFNNRKQMKAMNDTAANHVTLENITFSEKNIRQYVFNRIGGKWMLTGIENTPINDSPNASFLDFYERFSVDNEFQIESMNDIVEFSAPDPDNDMENMTGTLLPDQWPAFKPEFMPSDSLYNIVYGDAEGNSTQRILVIEGKGSGMRTEMTFRLKNGKWVLTRFNS